MGSNANTHTHAYACTQATASDPPAKIIRGEHRKCSGRLKSKVSDAGRHMDSKIQLITVSNKSSLP